MFFEVFVEYLYEEDGDLVIIEVLLCFVGDEFECYVKVKKNILEEVLSVVVEVYEFVCLVDFVFGYLGVEVD